MKYVLSLLVMFFCVLLFEVKASTGLPNNKPRFARLCTEKGTTTVSTMGMSAEVECTSTEATCELAKASLQKCLTRSKGLLILAFHSPDFSYLLP